MRRRGFLATLGALASGPVWPAEVAYPVVEAGDRLVFPRDFGSHPNYRTEWWYATGWLKTARGEDLGFQVTFFRTRLPYTLDNPSTFAPRQMLVAHAGLSDAKSGRLRHDQRAARPVLGVAGAEERTTRVWIDAWRLELDGARYRTTIEARDFAFTLELSTDREPLLQGVNGYSRKGNGAGEASHYYSRPGLVVRGTVERGSDKENVTGRAWLDHEWSSAYLPQGASGWDWIGINLEDGGALMAFRMRGKSGEVQYAGGTLMQADGTRLTLGPADIEFSAVRRWRSPRSGTDYPVSMRVRIRDAVWRLEPLLDDQELDSRASTATIYWEGAVRAFREKDAAAGPAGTGYLELTGYWRPLRL